MKLKQYLTEERPKRKGTSIKAWEEYILVYTKFLNTKYNNAGWQGAMEDELKSKNAKIALKNLESKGLITVELKGAKHIKSQAFGKIEWGVYDDFTTFNIRTIS
jgi:hypothetical protein